MSRRAARAALLLKNVSMSSRFRLSSRWSTSMPFRLAVAAPT
jgi:hypothetical protein